MRYPTLRLFSPETSSPGSAPWSVLAVKLAYDRAAGAAGGFPEQNQVVKAFEFMEWSGLGGAVRMAAGNGHQAITDTPVGYSKYDPESGKMKIADVIYFDAECVNAPAGWKLPDWIEAGFPGAKCD